MTMFLRPSKRALHVRHFFVDIARFSGLRHIYESVMMERQGLILVYFAWQERNFHRGGLLRFFSDSCKCILTGAHTK